MKKKLLTFLSIIVLCSACGAVLAKSTMTPELANVIKLYKAGNYAQCYLKVDAVIKQDPSNALAYYYKAISATKIGKKEEAITNYDKAITLAPEKSNLSKYAIKGKKCLETPDKCNEPDYTDVTEKLIEARGKLFSEGVESQYEKLKIENMMREINREEDIAPEKFKEYKDFSSMNTNIESMPTNDEIIAAIRVLQKAGLYNNGINNNYSELSFLNNSQYNYSGDSMLDLMGNTSLNPQVIQALLTRSNSLGF